MSQETKFCHRCGAALPSGATFCPRCGTAVAAAPAAGQVAAAPAPPSRAVQYERHEKHEKQEKHEKGEKQEKGRGDLAGAITGGLVLILLGILLYYATVGTTVVTFGNFWQYFIIGMGAILILQGLIRFAERKTFFVGSFIGGIVLMLIGLVFVSTNNFTIWPLILVVLGVAAIASAFSARRRAPSP